MQEAEFSIRFDGIFLKFCCKRLNGHKKRIRKARALLVRGKVITAHWNQYWSLNKNRTHWIFYAPYRVVSIPSHEVYWALSASDRDDTDVETYGCGKITRWRIIKRESFCRVCDVPGVVKPNLPAYICDNCLERLKNLEPKMSEERHLTLREFEKLEEKRSVLLKYDKLTAIAQQDRSHNLRWLRKFVAQGSFTPSQFKALCRQYGNVCLRCSKKRILVPDHVIPLARGGKNDITNIQPLCRMCNGMKGTDSTDYRKKRRNG